MALLEFVEPLLTSFIEQINDTFGNRIISIFKFGSLGDHGDFSLCSDVDVAVMLDQLKNNDAKSIGIIGDELSKSDLTFSDKLSIFWSSYKSDDFSQGKGRFPALDRLDLIKHAILISGTDLRNTLPSPIHDKIIEESAEFILSYMLTKDKTDELYNKPQQIMQKGARYFSKFVLFPVRLIFTLENPNAIASNKEAVDYFSNHHHHKLPPAVIALVKQAYELRSTNPDTEVKLDATIVESSIQQLYLHCIQLYNKFINKPEYQNIYIQLEIKINELEALLNEK